MPSLRPPSGSGFSGLSTKRGGGKGLSTKKKKKLFFNASFIFIWSRWKIKYILFRATYPIIIISLLVYYVLVVLVWKLTHGL